MFTQLALTIDVEYFLRKKLKLKQKCCCYKNTKGVNNFGWIRPPYQLLLCGVAARAIFEGGDIHTGVTVRI